MIYGYTKDREKAWEIIEKLGLCSEQESKVQFTMADRKINAVMSTSAGRLFDAVSAILGIRRQSSFEGEASTALQFAAETFGRRLQSDCIHEQAAEADFECMLYRKQTTENLSVSDVSCILNTEALVQQIVTAKLQGIDSGALAYLFHRTLAEQIVAACKAAREDSGRAKVALSGGVFQNRLLLRLTEEGLEQEGFEVLRHHMIPPNDGGIAIGQAAYGLYYLQNVKKEI